MGSRWARALGRTPPDAPGTDSAPGPVPDGCGGWAGRDVAAPLPLGWTANESLRLLAPDGGANVVVSSDPRPLGPGGVREVAEHQGRLLQRELPQYQEVSLQEWETANGTACVRDLTWCPDDGVPVRQLQMYLVHEGRSYLVTATSPATTFESRAHEFRTVLRHVRLGQSSTG